jgi:4-aminobutyrate aminotransferase-like enzyme
MTTPFSINTLPNSLAAAKLAGDPRIGQAMKLLTEAIEEHRAGITAVRPPTKALQTSYKDLLDTFAEVRGGNLWYPYIGSGIGNGALVELCDGSVKYDFISGIGPHYFGHSSTEMLQPEIAAALSDTCMQGHLQQTQDGLALSQLLLEGAGMAPGAARSGHCFLTTSGVMAVENALKIAFQARHPANRLLAFNHCFMGRTLAASQITDKAASRNGLPDTLHVDSVPFYDVDDPAGSTERAVEALRAHITRYPGKHAVMCFEMVQGEGGFRVGSTAFFEALMKVCKEHDILVLIDEVQSFGRTPSLFAYQHFGVEGYVDLVTVGKVLQVCATLFRSELKPKPGLLSQTFTGSTSSLRTGYAILDAIMHQGYLGPEGKIASIHNHFCQNLQNLATKHPTLIEGPYGIGGMIAFTPYGGDAKRVSDFTHRLFDNGLISFIAGSSPTRVRFLPPVGALTLQDIDNAVAIVEKTLLS